MGEEVPPPLVKGCLGGCAPLLQAPPPRHLFLSEQCLNSSLFGPYHTDPGLGRALWGGGGIQAPRRSARQVGTCLGHVLGPSELFTPL